MSSTLLRSFASIGLILIAGAIYLHHPFHGDTALFQLGAKEIAQGSRYYVDFWDNKQPGIYYFNVIAGKLFGFTEEGAHALDLLWNVAFAAVLLVAMKSRLKSGLWLAAPWVTVGLYFAFGFTWFLLQPEELVCFPLFCCLVLASGDPDRSRRTGFALFASGLCAGVVVLFKLMFAPIPAAFWLLAGWYAYTDRKLAIVDIIRWQFLPAALGVAVVLAGVCGWAYWTGNLSELLWTTFAFPIEAASTLASNSIWNLVRGTLYFGAATSFWLLGAAYLALVSLKARPPLFVAQLFAWVIVGLLVILLQKLSWWSYHFLLLVTPTGLLGLCGLELFVETPLASRLFGSEVRATWILLPLAFAPAIAEWTAQAIRHGPGALLTDAGAIQAYQRRVSDDYDKLAQEVNALSLAPSDSGPIYVMGNPIAYRFAARDQAIPTNGWSWEISPSSIWARLDPELRKAMPAYVAVSEQYRLVLGEKSPGAQALLNTCYDVLQKSSDYTWYRRRAEPHACVASIDRSAPLTLPGQ